MSIAEAKQLKIAIIDSGINKNFKTLSHLCADGHKSFTGSPWDEDGTGEMRHGTNIAQIISNYIGNVPNYCLLIYKVIDMKAYNLETQVSAAINFAIQNEADVINISLSEQIPNLKERKAIEQALDQNIVVIVAAGNNNIDLDIDCIIYPACYKFTKIEKGKIVPKKGFTVVGNYQEPGIRNPTSNRGQKTITSWEVGTNIRAGGVLLTGTSQAAAALTGKLSRRFLTRVPVSKKGDYESGDYEN